MPYPIETAYAAASVALAAALVDCGFLPVAKDLRIDPPAAFEPDGDETGTVTAAALMKSKTAPVQTFMGGPHPRYAVEREFDLELAVCGAEVAGKTRVAILNEAAAACSVLVENDPTLAGLTERWELSGVADDDLPPNGIRAVLTFTIRVRSSDRLGMSA